MADTLVPLGMLYAINILLWGGIFGADLAGWNSGRRKLIKWLLFLVPGTATLAFFMVVVIGPLVLLVTVGFEAYFTLTSKPDTCPPSGCPPGPRALPGK